MKQLIILGFMACLLWACNNPTPTQPISELATDSLPAVDTKVEPAPAIHPASAKALAHAFAKGDSIELVRTIPAGKSAQFMCRSVQDTFALPSPAKFLLIGGHLSASGPWHGNRGGASVWSLSGRKAGAGEPNTAIFWQGGYSHELRHWDVAQLADTTAFQITLDDGSTITGHVVKQ